MKHLKRIFTETWPFTNKIIVFNALEWIKINKFLPSKSALCFITHLDLSIIYYGKFYKIAKILSKMVFSVLFTVNRRRQLNFKSLRFQNQFFRCKCIRCDKSGRATAVKDSFMLLVCKIFSF